MDLIILVILFILFALIIVSFVIKKLDFVVMSLLCSSFAAIITGYFYGLQFETFILFIDFKAIIIILSFSIMSKIAQDSYLLEYIAIRLFRLAKGDLRKFFYLLCIISALLSSVITDVIVVIILAPMIVRFCHYLKTKAGTYLIGMAICINIGSIITPFSSGENVIISSYFNLNIVYFIQNYWLFSFLILFLSIILLDFLILKKEVITNKNIEKTISELMQIDIFKFFLKFQRPEKFEREDKKYSSELQKIIENRKLFYFNGISIIITIGILAIFPFAFLISLISASLLVLINQKFTNKRMSVILRNVEWEIIFFFIALYITVGCILEAGFQQIIVSFSLEGLDPFLLDIMILGIVSILSGLIVNTPVAIIFNPIIEFLILEHGLEKDHILFAYIMGINISSNFLPHGAVSDMMILKTAKDNDVKNISYRRLFKYGSIFALIHTLLAIGYIYLLIHFL